MQFLKFDDICNHVESTEFEDLLYTALIGAFRAEDISCDFVSGENEQLITQINEMTNGKYAVILGDTVREEIQDLKNNLSKYVWLYGVLNDEKSRSTLTNLLAYRLTRDPRYTAAAFDVDGEQYFDTALVYYPQDCVFVDCGAFDGCTAAGFACHHPTFKRMYLYEPMTGYYEQCCTYTQLLGDRAVVRKAGVYEKATIQQFSSATPGSSRVSDSGEIVIHTVALDEDVHEPIGFLKMDIEGSESAALKGAQKHIAVDAPVLAICVYHKPADFWQLTEQILTYNADYDLYLRHYTPYTDETVLYGIPRGKQAQKKNSVFAKEAIAHDLVKYADYLARETHRLNALIQYFLTQLENHRSAVEELRSWAAQQEKTIKSLTEQIMTYQGNNEELRKWTSELEAGKEYLADQVTAYQKETEELRKWAVELEEGKEYLADQLTARQKETEELRKWTAELEEGKEYLAGQLDNYQKLAQERSEMLDTMSAKVIAQEETIEQLHNESNKLRYLLRQEIDKPWYKKLRKAKTQ